jgi:ribosomal protein L11 methyltransferase
MTNQCLTIGPLSRETAEHHAGVLESMVQPAFQALSISECDQSGLLWQVHAYYLTADDASRAAIIAVSRGIDVDTITLAPVQQADWVNRSLAGLPPVRAGRFFVCGSHDRQLKPQNGVAIEIDAGTAFGTGHHGTTRGCLLALEHLLKGQRPRWIADIGCGSGILSIAAARATQAVVVASDIDPEAVRVTRCNAHRNSAKVVVLRADGANHPVIRANGPYDVIMANLLARPLAEMAPELSRIIKKRGHLVLSGLLPEQRQWIERTYRQFDVVPQLRLFLEGWTTLLLRHL